MSDVQDLTSRLSSLIQLVTEQFQDPELNRVPEERRWVRALASECFNLGVAMTRSDAEAIQKRHQENLELGEKQIAASLQSNEVAAALNAQHLERQTKRDEKWEELCIAQNETLNAISSVLHEMHVSYINRQVR